ncbi:M23 family metallopeptidase [Cloacibacillus sp. An23]|uniref:M23 family metallopeptidase n=1 Tax=Cloacibacillus sp. An23 TaxID=1965591 RepID=UPI000B3A9501|nr:M23 family metallopeptidase [Cloacibacillus sp. An23]OUO95188.1 hypothetical protein B5F39_01275 [Cloacibacillus sp. An23]
MRKFMKLCAAAALAVLLAAGCGAADVAVKAPSEVKIGRPFLVRVEARAETLSDVKVSWLGQEAPLSAAPDGVYSVLLGSDVKGTEPGEAELAVTFRSGGGDEERVAHRVKLLPHSYPAEKLTVAPSKASPPSKEAERIKREAELGRAAVMSTRPGHAPSLPLVRPVPGIFTSNYGKSRWFNGKFSGRHGGADMRAKTGTQVKAAADGVVTLAGDFYFAGRCVYVDHGAGFTTFYCHLSKISVKAGGEVKAGQTIGLSGSSGRVTGPHLHFSTAWRGIYFDPEPLLAK